MNKIYRDTPWDKNIFNLKTCELIDLEQDKEIISNKIKLLKKKYDLIYTRIDVSDFLTRRLLDDLSFSASEVSSCLKLNKLQKNIFDKYSYAENVYLETIDFDKVNELNEIIDKSSDMYSYSRFHESPFVEKDLANKRMKEWVVDLINKKNECYLLKETKTCKLIGYMFVTTCQNKAELLLGGTFKGMNLYALYLWSKLLLKLKNNNFNYVTTRVSLANKGVLKIYQSLGFEIEKTEIDYQFKSISER